VQQYLRQIHSHSSSQSTIVSSALEAVAMTDHYVLQYVILH